MDFWKLEINQNKLKNYCERSDLFRHYPYEWNFG